MKKNNGLLIIVGIVIVFLYLSSQTDKKTFSASDTSQITRDKLDIIISSSPSSVNPSSQVKFNVRVISLDRSAKSFYVECGMYDKSSSWLQQLLQTQSVVVSGYGEVPNCVVGETNVYTRSYSFANGDTETTQEYVLTALSDTSKDYVLLCQPYVACGNQPTNRDISFKDIALTTQQTNTRTFVEGLNEDELSSLTSPIIAQHACGGTDQEITCKSGSICRNLQYLETNGLLTGAQSDNILAESRNWWQRYFSDNILDDIFDNEAKSEVGVCLNKSNGFCLEFADSMVRSFYKTGTCQDNTIIFIVGMLSILMIVPVLFGKR